MLTPDHVRADMKTQSFSTTPRAGHPILPSHRDRDGVSAPSPALIGSCTTKSFHPAGDSRSAFAVRTKTQRGFTLMELMVVLVIVGIVAGLGIPSFARLIRDGELTSQTNSVASALQTARSEAISRSVSVMVCPADTSSTPADCDGNDWTNGWVVAEDPDHNNTVDSSSDIIRQKSADTKISSASDDPSRIRYTPEGLAKHDTTQTISLQRPQCGSQKDREIEISTTGRVQINKVDC